MSTLAIIPAKLHSAGVPGKNWKPIHPDGRSCVDLAIDVARATCDAVVTSIDTDTLPSLKLCLTHLVRRPAALPDAMSAVIQHVLDTVPGDPQQILVLLQPSSPLRRPETVRKAIDMLVNHPDADSVVSVSPSYPLEWSLAVDEPGTLLAYDGDPCLGDWPDRRQDCRPTWKRDGAVYVFRRLVFEIHGNIYGNASLPLYTDSSEALSIDTDHDWAAAVTCLRSRSLDA